jgi:hypothetical protein
MLLQTKIDINVPDKDNFSALGIAIREDKFKIAHILLSSPHIIVNKGGGYTTLLHLGIGKLKYKLVDELI